MSSGINDMIATVIKNLVLMLLLFCNVKYIDKWVWQPKSTLIRFSCKLEVQVYLLSVFYEISWNIFTIKICIFLTVIAVYYRFVTLDYERWAITVLLPYYCGFDFV